MAVVKDLAGFDNKERNCAHNIIWVYIQDKGIVSATGDLRYFNLNFYF